MQIEKINPETIQWGLGITKRNQFTDALKEIESLRVGEAIKISFDVPRTSFCGEVYKTFNRKGVRKITIRNLNNLNKIFFIKKISA